MLWSSASRIRMRSNPEVRVVPSYIIKSYSNLTYRGDFQYESSPMFRRGLIALCSRTTQTDGMKPLIFRPLIFHPANPVPMILPDVLAPGLDLVLCGTAPSRASKEAGAYYARPGNRFWPTLHLVGLTPRLLKPAEYAEVLDYGLGLTDLCKTEWASDQELTNHCFDIPGFTAKIERYRPAAVAFDSKHAGKNFFRRASVSYGRQ